MRRHVHVHFHDEQAHDPSNGQFAGVGKMKAMASSNAHQLLDPGFVANMHPGQKKLSGIK